MGQARLSPPTQQQHQYQQQFMGKEHTAELIRKQISAAVPARTSWLESMMLPGHESHHSPRIVSVAPARTPSLGSLQLTGNESRNSKQFTASSPRGAAVGPGLLGPFSTPPNVSQAHSFSPIVTAVPGGGYSAMPPLNFLRSPSQNLQGAPANPRPPSVLYMSNGLPLSPRAQIKGEPFGQPGSLRVQVNSVPSGWQPLGTLSPRAQINGRPSSQPGSLRAQVNSVPSGWQPLGTLSPHAQINGRPSSQPGSPRPQMNHMSPMSGSPRRQSSAEPMQANQKKPGGSGPWDFQDAAGWDFFGKPVVASSTEESPSNRVLHAEFL